MKHEPSAGSSVKRERDESKSNDARKRKRSSGEFIEVVDLSGD